MSKQPDSTRRTFLKVSGALGAAAAAGSVVFTKKAEALSYTEKPPDAV